MASQVGLMVVMFRLVRALVAAAVASVVTGIIEFIFFSADAPVEMLVHFSFWLPLYITDSCSFLPMLVNFYISVFLQQMISRIPRCERSLIFDNQHPNLLNLFLCKTQFLLSIIKELWMRVYQIKLRQKIWTWNP